MTDDRRLQIELYLDDELSAGERKAVEDVLEVDAEASRYLSQLRRLRTLAIRHDPAPIAQPAKPSAAARIYPVVHWAATLVVAASLGAVAIHVSLSRPPTAVEPALVQSPTADLKLKSDVDWYLWANADDRSATAAVKASLTPLPKHGGRKASREILIIEMANSDAPAIRTPRSRTVRRNETARRGAEKS